MDPCYCGCSVHKVKGKFYFEIPRSVLGKDFLWVSRIAQTPQIGYGGEKANTQVVRWERFQDNILLRVISYSNVAADFSTNFPSRRGIPIPLLW